MVWQQNESDIYRRLSAIAVPQRAEQIATILTLIPFGHQDQFRVVELASGEGYLSNAILRAFPKVSVTALDIEVTMRTETENRSKVYSDRLETASFDIQNDDWYPYLASADVVVSSLCIHHLDDSQKQDLFRAVGERISTTGALLIADLVMAKRTQCRELFSSTWDRSAREIAASIDASAFELFQAERWNYYRYPDDFDKPSPLSDQLIWLKVAGFQDVDCFWMKAGHAIYIWRLWGKCNYRAY